MEVNIQRHEDAVLDCIARMKGITKDMLGDFKMPSGSRYHPEKTIIRKQHNTPRGWVNIWSAYYTDIKVTDDGQLNVLKKF